MFRNTSGFAQVMFVGVVDGFSVMVMELLGRNLEELLQYCGKKFTLKTVITIAMQLVCSN
jgi:hypothetical protein